MIKLHLLLKYSLPVPYPYSQLTPYLYSISEKDLAEKDFSKSVFAAE